MHKNSAPLARARIRAGLSQEQAARKLEINTQYLCRVERGVVQASKQLIARVGRLYDLDPGTAMRHHRSERRLRLQESAPRRARRHRGSKAA